MNPSASPPSATAPSTGMLVSVFVSLLVLLAISALCSRLVAGTTGAIIALMLAVAKTTLVFVYFMRLRYQSGLVRLFAVAGFFWLSLIGVFTFADYLTR